MHRLRKASYEKVATTPGRSFAFRKFDLPAFDSPWHFHPEFELTLVTGGSGRRFVGDHIAEYGPGDLVLLAPDLPHFWHTETSGKSGERSRSLVVQFLPGFLGAGFLELPELDSVKGLLANASRGLRFTGRTQRRGSEILIRMATRSPQGQLLGLLDALDVLSRSPDVEMLSTKGFAPALDTRTEERINRCQTYIFDNLNEPMRLEDVAAHMSMSPSAFSRYFKRVIGKTFSHFVAELRVGKACRVLLESDRPIAEIAYQSGFNNLSNFNRRFKDLRGVSPRQFRDLHQIEICEVDREDRHG
ncbi:MAG: AraC family transcriptional regulator [Woeseiaceae bacterium]